MAVIEVGMGGREDATNVLIEPAAASAALEFARRLVLYSQWVNNEQRRAKGDGHFFPRAPPPKKNNTNWLHNFHSRDEWIFV